MISASFALWLNLNRKQRAQSETTFLKLQGFFLEKKKDKEIVKIDGERGGGLYQPVVPSWNLPVSPGSNTQGKNLERWAVPETLPVSQQELSTALWNPSENRELWTEAVRCHFHRLRLAHWKLWTCSSISKELGKRLLPSTANRSVNWYFGGQGEVPLKFEMCTPCDLLTVNSTLKFDCRAVGLKSGLEPETLSGSSCHYAYFHNHIC